MRRYDAAQALAPSQGAGNQGSPTLRSRMGAGPRKGSAAAHLLRRPGSLRCPLLITFPRASGNIPPTPRESLILWDPKVALPSLRPHRFPRPPFTDPLTSQPQPLPRTPHPLPTRAPSFSHSPPHSRHCPPPGLPAHHGPYLWSSANSSRS